ncbi:unnamed protein product [Alopecurus aequalis]
MMESSRVPPGFRFHPTDEELVGYYLRKKVASQRIDLDVIPDVDLYGIEPWELQERCRIGYEEQNDWYFFSYKDRKYPTGRRTNRATATGFWKATGRDKAVRAKAGAGGFIIGMRKTLVFYEGRAPNGRKSDWIVHEYRLDTDENGPPQREYHRSGKKGMMMHVILPRSGLTAQVGAVVLQGSHHWIETESTIATEKDCMVMMLGETGYEKKVQAEGRMITTIGAEIEKRTGEREGE